MSIRKIDMLLHLLDQEAIYPCYTVCIMHDNISLKTKFKIVMKYKNDNIVLLTVLVSVGLVVIFIISHFLKMMNDTESG